MSCHDNDDVEPLVQLNKYRAKEIKGHNALWGDFKISLNYIGNKQTDILKMKIKSK